MSSKPGQKYAPWTTAEITILKNEWPVSGVVGVQKLLPHRTYNQLRGAAYRYRLRVEGRAYAKQPSTEWIDAAIQRAYRTPQKLSLKKLAQSLGRTHGWVKWRAQVLGLTRPRGARKGIPLWTDAEIAHLEACLDRNLAISGIHASMKRAGYQRSLGAILAKITHLGLRFNREWWNASETASALNVDIKVVTDWIEKGMLKAKKQTSPATLPGEAEATWWRIDRTELRAFLIRYPCSWDHRRVKIEILLEMLCFGKKGGIGAFRADDDERAA